MKKYSLLVNIYVDDLQEVDQVIDKLEALGYDLQPDSVYETEDGDTIREY